MVHSLEMNLQVRGDRSGVEVGHAAAAEVRAKVKAKARVRQVAVSLAAQAVRVRRQEGAGGGGDDAVQAGVGQVRGLDIATDHLQENETADPLLPS